MREDDLIICSQTVYGWSFGNRRWRKPLFSTPQGPSMLISYKVEFVVENIKDIVWNRPSFDNLVIPTAKKNVITALATSLMSRAYPTR